MKGKLIADKKFTKMDNNTMWPSFIQPELSWRLRYIKNPSRVDLLMAASIISAYHELISMPQKKRNETCKALKEAK